MNQTTIIIKNNVRIYVTDVTEIAQKSIDIHQSKPIASLAIGTSLAVFNAFSCMKKDIRTSINIKGDGALKNILFESDGRGGSRILVGDPNVVTDADENNFNNIPLTIGVGSTGTMKIVHTTEKINFGGEVKLAKGDITTDLAWYLDQSEQINSAVISSVVLEETNKFKHAKAIIFQMLPDHSEIDVRWVEEFIKNNSLRNSSVKSLIDRISGKILEVVPLEWKCFCSKEKMFNAARTLGKREFDKIVSEDGFVEVNCAFCKQKYQFTEY